MKYLFVVLFLVSSFAFADQQYKTHRVSRGETVESIAKDYGVPASEIYKLNPDARNGISRNSTLIVPTAKPVQQEEEISFATHKVKQKETLYSISREYNVSIDEIKRYNKFLYAEPLKKGDRLRIPQISQNNTSTSNTEVAVSENENKPATREHTVLPKETMYGISREYGLTVEELEAMNPWVDTLQPGMMLKIYLDTEKYASDKKELENFRIHEVQPKETMYSLTREYGISRDSLISLNPDLKDGLKAGMNLKLPKEKDKNPMGDRFSISENLENQIRNREVKDIALILPFNLEKIEIDSVDMAKDRIRRDQVLQISLDFYSGVLLAVDSASKKGIPVNLQVFDSKQSVAQISEIINTNNFSQFDAVVGPLLQEPAEAAAMQLSRYNIPVVSPFSTKMVRNLNNFVQTRPTKEMMEEVVIRYLRENSENKNIIIIAENASGVKNKLIAALPNAKVVNPKSGGVVPSGELSAALSRSKENWIVVETSSVGLLSGLTSRLNALRDSYNISLFTTDRNKAFESDNISNRHLGNLNFHYPSVDKEYDALRNQDFITAYKKLYGMEPNQYAVRGFDITYDLLLRLAVFDSLYESFERFTGTTEYAENKFHYQKMDDGGYFNNAMYLIKYDSNLRRNVVR